MHLLKSIQHLLDSIDKIGAAIFTYFPLGTFLWLVYFTCLPRLWTQVIPALWTPLQEFEPYPRTLYNPVPQIGAPGRAKVELPFGVRTTKPATVSISRQVFSTKVVVVDTILGPTKARKVEGMLVAIRQLYHRLILVR